MQKIIAVLTCDNCGESFNCYHRKRLEAKNHFCSKKCEGEYRTKNNPNYLPCSWCKKLIYVKPNKQKKEKNHFCCMDCFTEWKKKNQFGENNPNYGNRGIFNPLWRSDIKCNNYGYLKVRCPEHPFADCDGFVRQHRLIAEQYLLDENNSVEINGKKYLRPEFDVHHIDHNRQNNEPSNLMILTRSEHSKLHSKEKHTT